MKNRKYFCHVLENLQGKGISSPLQLDVYYPPSCTEPNELDLFTSVHQSFDLSCEMDANPKNLTFHWQRFSIIGNQKPMQIKRSQFTQHETKSVLTLTPRTPQDFGQVVCSATNEAGQGTSCSFTIRQRVSLLYMVNSSNYF